MLDHYRLRYDEASSRSEDYDLWVRMSRMHKIANIPKALLEYRHNKQTIKVHKKEAEIQAQHIRAKQLNEMGVEYTEEELKLHDSVSTSTFNKSTNYANHVGDWLIKIRNANIESGTYNRIALDEELEIRWWAVCNYAAGCGLDIWRLYNKKRICDSTKGNRYNNIKLLSKALLRVEL